MTKAFVVAAVVIAWSHAVIAQDSVVVAIPIDLGDSVTEDALKDWYAKLIADGRELRLPDLSLDRLGKGHVGRIPYAFDPASPTPFVKTQVLQVLTDKEMLLNVQCFRLEKRITGRVVGSARPVEGRSITVLLRGVSTDDVADDEWLKFGGAYKVTGTDSYPSIAGKRTVYVLEPTRITIPKLDDPEIVRVKEELARTKDAAKRAREESERKAAVDAKLRRITELDGLLTRTWEDSSGKFKVEARLSAVLTGPVARLTRADGTVIEVKFFQLRREDREWILSTGKPLLELRAAADAE